MLIILDYLFHLLHIVTIVINCFGWIHPKTRKIHLVVFTITAISWIGLGAIYGFGYCFLTDWHWQVKASLGHSHIPASYFTYWLNNIFGLAIDPSTIDSGVFIIFIVILISTGIVHLKQYFGQRG